MISCRIFVKERSGYYGKTVLEVRGRVGKKDQLGGYCSHPGEGE